MKKSITILAPMVIVFIGLAAFTILDSSWNIEPNYSIKFSGKKAEGTFSGFKGKILFDRNDLQNSIIDVTVEVSTIKTGNDTKDEHAKGESWFNVAKYPTIHFVSTTFSNTSVTGILEMHGTKKEMVIPFVFVENGSKANFNGHFKVNRKDFGINGNMMGFMVGDEFGVDLNIPISKQ